MTTNCFPIALDMLHYYNNDDEIAETLLRLPESPYFDFADYLDSDIRDLLSNGNLAELLPSADSLDDDAFEALSNLIYANSMNIARILDALLID